jgi:adenylate kinase family enzyme
MKKVIILTGPGGSGKTTIAELIVKKRGYILIDGDNEDSKFFPNGDQWLPENTEKLKQAHNKILQKTEQLVKDGNNVVVDYIIFGRYTEFLDKFKKSFGNDLDIKVLLPAQDEIIKRDRERENWTTGIERITAVSTELESIKEYIGADNFIDTSKESPEKTFEKYFK